MIVGCQTKGLGDIIQCGGTDGAAISVVDVGAAPRMGWALGSFQHGVARQIPGRQKRRREEGGREYPMLAAAMEDTGSEEIGAYILNR